MGKRVLQLYPKNVLFRNNFALYAMYAGDFATATRESEPLLKDPGDASLLQNLPAAGHRRRRLNGQPDRRDRRVCRRWPGRPRGRLARVGRPCRHGDLPRALQAGRSHPARGIEADAKVEQHRGRGGEAAHACRGVCRYDRTTQALTAVGEALKLGKSESILVPAARLYLAGGKERRPKSSRPISTTSCRRRAAPTPGSSTAIYALLNRPPRLGDRCLPRRHQARGLLAGPLRHGRGLRAGRRLAEALSEFDACEKRRGEATAIFLDDMPDPPLPGHAALLAGARAGRRSDRMPPPATTIAPSFDRGADAPSTRSSSMPAGAPAPDSRYPLIQLQPSDRIPARSIVPM